MYRFKVLKMSCQGCVKRITQSIQLLDPNAQVVAELTRHELTINSSLSLELLAQQLANSGYEGEYIGMPVTGAKL